MTDTDVIKPLQGTAFFSRKVSDGNYGSIEASHFVQYEQSSENAAALAFTEAKCNVLEQLGLAYEFTTEGVVIESPVEEKFTSQAQTAASVERAFAPATNPTSTNIPRTTTPAPSGNTAKVKVWSRIVYPDGRKNDRGEIAKVPNPSWLAAAAAEAGVTDVWDNRKDHPAFGGPAKTKNGKDARKLPYFKEKDGETAFWPPRDHADAAPNYVHPDFAGDPRSTPNDDEETF